MAGQAEAQPTVIAYAPHPRSRVRRLRPILLAVLIVGSAWPGWRIGSNAVQRSRHWYWHRQCATFSPAANTVVFEALLPGARVPTTQPPYINSDDPSIRANWMTVAPRKANPNQPVLVLRVPTCLTRLFDADPTVNWSLHGQCVAFCHERTSPGGRRQLIAIVLSPLPHFDERLNDSNNLVLEHVFRDDLGLGETSLANIFEKAPDPLPLPRRIFAGQVDPEDSSHFTIEYEWPDNQHGIIDGWLLDNDIKLSIRPGPGDLESAQRSLREHTDRWKYQ